MSVMRCPVCKKPSAPATRPFCSKRCKDIDLARWLGGGYAIGGGPAETAEDGTPEIPEGVAGDDDERE